MVAFFSGIVGEIGESKDEYYIWTHKKFDISYNGDQIVDVSLTSESKAKLMPDSKISCTYEVCTTKQHLIIIFMLSDLSLLRYTGDVLSRDILHVFPIM